MTDLNNWDKDFESPFKSDVYFFSTRFQIDQRWGTATPITIREKEFGAVRTARVRHLTSLPHRRSAGLLHQRKRHARALPRGGYRRPAPQPGRARLTEVVASLRSWRSWHMAAHQATDLRRKSGGGGAALLYRAWAEARFLGDREPVASRRTAERCWDRRIGANLAGDLGRYTQFEAAQSLETAAANTGGSAGAGVGIGAAAVRMAQTMNECRRGAAPSSRARRCAGRRRQVLPGAAGGRFPARRSSARNAESPRPPRSSGDETARIAAPRCASRMATRGLACDYCKSVYFPEKNEDGIRVLDDPSEFFLPGLRSAAGACHSRCAISRNSTAIAPAAAAA